MWGPLHFLSLPGPAPADFVGLTDYMLCQLRNISELAAPG